MKNLLLLSLLFFTICAYAQKGKIRGTLIDDASGEPLFNATVVVKGTNNGVISDLDGNFMLETEAGTVDLILSYISYQTITLEGIEVKANEITVLNDIIMKEDIEQAIEVVIEAEAIRSNESGLINIKMKSAGMLDGISSDKIRQIGDGNVAEATKRVTGVTVEGGKYVYVRGLGDRYSKTTLNGVDIPGLDPDRNSLQMDIFPTNLINNVMISKNFTAELPADFTGGLLNIETKDFPEEKLMSFSFGTAYNPQYHFNKNFLSYKGGNTDFLGFDDGTRALPNHNSSKVPTPYSGASMEDISSFIGSFSPTLATTRQLSILDFNGSFSIGNQIDLKKRGTDELSNNKLGYIFSLSYKSDYKFYDDVAYGEYQRAIDSSVYELNPATTQKGELSERSFLVGAIGGIAYKTSTSKFKFTAMHLQNGESRAGKFTIENNSSAVGQSGYSAVSENLEYNQRSLTNVLLNGTHLIKASNWEIDWRISPTYSTSEDPDIRKTAFSINGNTARFNPGEAGNPSRIWRSLNELNATAKIDLTKKLTIGNTDLKIRFGASETYKLRNYSIQLYEILFSRPQSWSQADASLVLAPDNVYPSSNNGAYIQSGNANPNPNEYSSNVNNTGAYVSGEFTVLRKLKTILGLRSEYFVQRHTGRDIAYASGDVVNGNNLSNQKVLESVNLFPTANLVYAATAKQNLRASYSRTIARPSFKELSYAQILDPITNRIFNGSLFSYSNMVEGVKTYTWDGNLKETNIDNLDLRWEWFMNNAQMFSVSAFYKNFRNPIELVRIPEQQTSTEYQTRNVGNGSLLGAEIELRKNFDFISETFKNLNFNINVTYVYSEIRMTDLEFDARKSYERAGQTIKNTRDMAGQSPYVINCGLSYNNPDIGLDVGVFYNVKGSTLVIVGTGLSPDIYSAPFHSLNLSVNQKLGKDKKTTIDFKISNLLNDRIESFYRSFQAQKQVFNSINPGMTFSFGLSHKF